MKQYAISTLLGLVAVCMLIIAPSTAQDNAIEVENLIESCVTDYNEDMDYFPEKVEVTHAENFTVEYFNNYKLVTVISSLGETIEYALVQCGTPTPDDLSDDTSVIEVPVDNAITLSTTHTVHMVELGLLDQLVGMDSFLYISSPDVRELIEENALVEVAPNFELNLEILLEAEPGIVTSGDFNPDQITLLQDAGLNVALNTEYLETSALGSAEWLKYTALFFNAEGAASEHFTTIEANYIEIRELTAEIPDDERPTVLWNAISPFSDTWGIPGAETSAGQLILDAGGNIAIGNEDSPESVAFVSLEVVYEGALAADIWITNLFNVTTIEDLLAIDARYEDFDAVQNGNVWNNDNDVNENGGNNYYELGVVNPALVLTDLTAIFHPELLPEHEFNFFRPMTSAEADE